MQAKRLMGALDFTNKFSPEPSKHINSSAILLYLSDWNEMGTNKTKGLLALE